MTFKFHSKWTPLALPHKTVIQDFPDGGGGGGANILFDQFSPRNFGRDARLRALLLDPPLQNNVFIPQITRKKSWLSF